MGSCEASLNGVVNSNLQSINFNEQASELGRSKRYK